MTAKLLSAGVKTKPIDLKRKSEISCNFFACFQQVTFSKVQVTFSKVHLACMTVSTV